MFSCEITERFSEVTKAFAGRELEAARRVAPEKTMLSFDEIIAECDVGTKTFIERELEQARRYVQSGDYDPEYDDITPHIFEGIGEALFEAAYPPEPEPEIEPPAPLIPGPGEEAHYCRHCEAARIFRNTDPEWPLEMNCTVCGKRRVTF